jgi:predicted RNase H-like HicB family nuclease
MRVPLDEIPGPLVVFRHDHLHGSRQRDPDTNLDVGYVPGFPGAHGQAESLDELQANLREVISLLLGGRITEARGLFTRPSCATFNRR